MMDREKGIKLCVCRMCPSFVDCSEETAYCLSTGPKSACIRDEQGCLCPGCPVLEAEGFIHVYYCTRGSETAQRAAR